MSKISKLERKEFWVGSKNKKDNQGSKKIGLRPMKCVFMNL